MKRRKILLGSIFVLVLILLMPSISAIQKKIIEDKLYNDLIDEIKEIEWVKHPILFFIILLIFNIRMIQGDLLLDVSYDVAYPPGYRFQYIKIIHPLMFIRGVWLIINGFFWIGFWDKLSNKLGWNWNINPY